MGNLITHNLTYSKESVMEYFITPLFIESDIKDLITIRTDIKNSEKLDFFDNLEKITKASAQGTGFTRSTGVTLTQKEITVSDLKAEISQNGKAFLKQVKESLLKKGYQENDISDTLFEEIIMSIFMDGLKADFHRQLWFGDKQKESRTSSIPNGSADVDYNTYDGFWKRIIDDVSSATIPAAQFLDLNTTTYLNTVAVAEVDTVTVSGTAGTLSLTVNGTTYSQVFATDATTTATNFVSTHAATILAREGEVIVADAGSGTLTLTSGIKGLGITTVDASSGGMTGSVANTTPNVATGTLKADQAQAIFKAMYEKMPPVMKKNKNLVKIMATPSVIDNYLATLESATAGSEAAYKAVIDGVEKLAYRRIEVKEMLDWGERISEDFNYYPHRVLMTIPKNLVFGTDGDSDDNLIEMWYEKKDQENVIRVEYKAGTQYIHEEFIVVAYA